MRGLILAGCLALAGCATSVQQVANTCLAHAHGADPDEEPTTQGHDRAQALMGDCMQARGFVFDWNERHCDHEYPTTIVKGGCYRRPE